MPVWNAHQITIWLVIMAGLGIVQKTDFLNKTHAAVGLYVLAAFAVYLAIYKPW